MRFFVKATRVSAMAALVASCSVGPDYVRPETPLPDKFVAAGDTSLPPPPTRWWTEFRVAELDTLVEEALASNHDLKIAMHRIAQSEAKAGVAAGELLPSLKMAGKGTMQTPDGGVGSTTTSTERSGKAYQIGLQASYEIDLWGKNRSAMEAALATAQGSVFNREVVAMTLVADVTTGYFQFLQACDRVKVANSNVDNMKRVLAKVTKRRQLGEGSDLEVAQQNSMLSQAEATLPILLQSRDQQLNKLALLLGRGTADLKIDCRPLAIVAIPEVRAGLPSELLLRRPDIRKAESDMVSANANIGMARAKLFPSLSLTGERGYGSGALINMLSPVNMFWTLAANAGQTIFDNGKTQAEIAYYEALFGEMVENYRKSIFSSFRDVDDALSTIRYSADRDQASAQRLTHALEARRLSERAFNIGIADYLTVLDTERTQYSAEDELVQARYARLAAAVALYKALGGGIAEAEPTLTKAEPTVIDKDAEPAVHAKEAADVEG